MGTINGDMGGTVGNAILGGGSATNISNALYATDSGSTDAYAITLSPAITSYTTGLLIAFKANTANTGAASLNVNSLGAKTIVKVVGGITTALATNDIRAGQIVLVEYDGTNFQMQSTLGNASGITNSATSGVLPKTVDGSGNLGASRITDDGTDTNIVNLAGNVVIGADGAGLGNYIEVQNTSPSSQVLKLYGAGTANGDVEIDFSRSFSLVGNNSSITTNAAGDFQVSSVTNTIVTNGGEASFPDGQAGTVALQAIVTNSSPTTGQTVNAATGKLDETLYITPAGTLLALTVSLPTSANSRVGQVERGFISQIITGLTVNVAGSGTVIGATPITSAVNSTFAYQCVSVSGNGTWIRIQ